MAAPEGVITCCSHCGRPLNEGDLWGDPCDPSGAGCEGVLKHSEDALAMEIRRLQRLQQERGAHDVVAGPHTVEAL